MLDKSIPYKNIIMRAEALSPLFTWNLPEGFLMKTFEPCDEKEWAAIETSVGEFDSEAVAEAYFVQTYMPFPEEIRRRCFFVLSPRGEYAGTCTAWYLPGGAREMGVVHWLGVRPTFQGLGIGKALLGKTMRFFKAADAYPAYLHTQTWSHKAIGLYVTAGFCLLKEATFLENLNDYHEAMEILRGIMPPDRLNSWMDSAK